MNDGGDYPNDVLADILAQLKALTQRIDTQNGRQSAMEKWRDGHQEWSEGGRDLIANQQAAIVQLQEQMTAVALACQVTPGNLEHAVERVMDKRQTTADAASYRALTRRFGSDPEESLNRWAGVKMGVRAVGWRVAGVAITVLVSGLLMWFLALWTVSRQGGP